MYADKAASAESGRRWKSRSISKNAISAAVSEKQEAFIKFNAVKNIGRIVYKTDIAEVNITVQSRIKPDSPVL
jgi:hypothetical protein